MGIGIGGEEKLKSFEEADAATVKKQNPTMSISSSESVKTSYGEITQSRCEEEDFDWVSVDREVDAVITDQKSPEVDEVEDALSALQLMFDDVDDDEEEESEDQVSESEFVDWIEPPLHLCNTSLLQPYMLDRLYDAFHMFQTDPSVQRMVMSLSSDRAVWDAVMNNEVVRELITNAETSEEEDSGSTANFIRRLFERSAIKIIDAMERVTKYVTDLFNVAAVVPEDETVVLATGAAPVMEKLQVTVLLTVLVLLIVLVTRVTRAK